MNKKTAKRLIKLLQAFIDEKEIQLFYNDSWIAIENPYFDYGNLNGYRAVTKCFVQTRIALLLGHYGYHTSLAESNEEENDMEEDATFVKWLTDRQIHTFEVIEDFKEEEEGDEDV